MRLLGVEDDSMIGSAVQRGLKQEGYAVDWARDGEAATLALKNEGYDLVLLDLGLPGKDGITLLTELRKAHNDVTVLIVTARDAVSDRIHGLDAGADDYLVKPFDLDELAARVRALLRRRGGSADPLLSSGPLQMDPAAHTVSLHGEAVPLAAKEFALLRILLEHPGTPVSRAELEERLYGWGEEVGSNTVEVYIHALRRKLGAEWIRNLRGVGWLVPTP